MSMQPENLDPIDLMNGLPFVSRASLLACLTCLTLATPRAADAQGARPPAPARTVQYVYLRGADTLGVETITLTDTTIAGVLALRGAPRMAWTHVRRGTTFGALGLRVYAPGAPEGAAPVQAGTIRVVGDSARIEFVAGGAARRQAAATKPGAVPLVNASVIHAALIGASAKAQGLASRDLFLSNGGQTMPAGLSTRGDTLVINIAGVESLVLAAPNDLPREVRVPSQNARVVRATVMQAAAGNISYDAPANAGYTTEQVRIPTGRGYELAGTLTRPVLNRTVGVVVTISGSGAQERDSRIPSVPGYAPFRDIADTLAKRGIAMLRYDDRGVGASGGLESARVATSADFADDVRSVVTWLSKRPDIDSTRIALAGHSEGGMIAPIVAENTPGVRAIALLAGNAYSGRRVIMGQNREAIDAAPGLTPAQRDSAWKTLPARLDTLATQSKWVAFFMAHDPLVTARRVKQPVLVLQGDTDRQVTPEQADTLGAAFRAGGNRNVTVRRFPQTNHLFLADSSGAAQGYGALKDTHVRREVLGALADWLVQVLR